MTKRGYVSDDEEWFERTKATGPPPPPRTCGIIFSVLQTMPVAERTKYDEETGELIGLCNNCTRDWRPIREAFLPSETGEKGMRHAYKLRIALDEHSQARIDEHEGRAAAALAVVLAKRTRHCRPCATKHKIFSPAQQACMDEWHRMKQEACRAQDGCMFPDCPERGMASWVCLSADHTDPSIKVCALSSITWWAGNGGVAAMREEAAKVQWPCLCCHMLLKTSASGQTRKEKVFKSQKDKDARVAEKRAYVDARKLQIGKCQYPGCGRPVAPATVRSFHFDHIDPRTKYDHDSHPHLISKSEDVRGIAAIVGNPLKHASLAHCKDVLDHEMHPTVSTLTCANCHTSRKRAKRARWDASLSCVPCE